MRNLVEIFLCFALIIATTGKVLDESWWKTASFYQIYPRSFKDSDGDGIGDLKGITQKLSYLKEIGIDATWISPIFTSPMADFGYDISNYKDIEPIFGTMEDFDELMAKSKEIGMKIILDFVPNHTSDEHEWFIKSAKNDPDYADFYIWHPGKIDANGTRIPPSNWIAAFRGSMWEWHEERQAYYLHQFHIKQPDLNYNSPKVREAMKDVLRFWLRKGVAGFRIDTVPTIYEVDPDADGNYPDEPHNPLVNNSADYYYLEHIYTKNQPRTYEVIYEFRQVLKEMDEELGGAQRILMTEAYEDINFVMLYYGNGTVDGANFPFNFEMILHVNRSSDAYVYSQTIHNWLDNMPEGRVANWVMGNHDVHRIGSRLGEDRIDIINILMKTLPGATITYQGEEIGMTGFLISWEQTVDPSGCQSNPEEYARLSRDPARTPFQWSDGFQAGFTDHETTWLPIHPDYKLINVKRERGIAYSHLNIYKQLQTLRNEKTMRYGEAEVTALNKNVLAIKRYLPNERTYLVLLNINDELEAINAKETFSDLSNQLKYVLTTDKSIRRKGDKVSSDHIDLLPKEAVILATI